MRSLTETASDLPKGLLAMRYLPFIALGIVLLTACSENSSLSPTSVTTTASSQQAQQPIRQYEETPSSLSGNEAYVGSNPHATLTAEQHIAVAMQHAEEGRTEEAMDVLTRAIIASPNDPSLIGTRGSMLLSQDRVYEALVDLDKAVSLAPGSALLLVNRSQAYRKFNRYEEAMADLDKAITIDPDLVPARFNRGSLLYGEARYEEALADFDVAIQIDPSTAGPYFNRAITRDAVGDRAGAVNDMNRFIKLSDNAEWEKVARETMEKWENEGQSTTQ